MHSSGCLHLTDKVSPTFRTQKNGVKKSIVTQWRMGKNLFPVQVWDGIFTRLDLYPVSSYDTPVNTVWAEKHNITTMS